MNLYKKIIKRSVNTKMDTRPGLLIILGSYVINAIFFTISRLANTTPLKSASAQKHASLRPHVSTPTGF